MTDHARKTSDPNPLLAARRLGEELEEHATSTKTGWSFRQTELRTMAATILALIQQVAKEKGLQQQLQVLALAILDKASAFHWSVHGFGVLRLYIRGVGRL